MKITQVSYLKTFPLGQYINEKIEIVVQLNEGDDVQSALSLARSECELNHRTNNPHLYQEQIQLDEEVWKQNTNEPLPTNVPILSQEQKIKQIISQSTTIKQLEEWKLIANNKQYPSLKELYNQRLKELTNDK